MDNSLVRLNVVGITYNQIENGMYAMVLEDEFGERRLPIIIGYNEAQSIECILQKIKTPRPLTHEFASEIINSFGIEIESVFIKQLENGIFAADVTFKLGQEMHVLDARSSDAIALAMRMKAPVFTSKSLLEKCGFEKKSFAPKQLHSSLRQSIPVKTAIERVKNPNESPFANDSIQRLKQLMEEAVAKEDYERAEEIKLEIERRQDSED